MMQEPAQKFLWFLASRTSEEIIKVWERRSMPVGKLWRMISDGKGSSPQQHFGAVNCRAYHPKHAKPPTSSQRKLALATIHIVCQKFTRSYATLYASITIHHVNWLHHCIKSMGPRTSGRLFYRTSSWVDIFVMNDSDFSRIVVTRKAYCFRDLATLDWDCIRLEKLLGQWSTFSVHLQSVRQNKTTLHVPFQAPVPWIETFRLSKSWEFRRL